MKKTTLVSLLAVMCIVGVALAAAVKVELLPYPVDTPVEPNASGHAVLNYAKGADKTEVQINCWGLMADSEYTAYIGSPWEAVGTFTTRIDGSGNLHVKLEGDMSTRLPVAVNNAGNSTVLLGE